MNTFHDYVKKTHQNFNAYSQNREDRIIKSIFDLIGDGNKRCIEFGAADGFFCSNTAYLWHGLFWQAHLAESSPELYQQLVANTSSYKNVTTTYDTVTSVDDLADGEIQDFVSIDVDGTDYTIWENTTLKHRVVCIEHNPTYPPHVFYHGGEWQGASAASINRLAETKGYTLVACTRTNLIFVVNEENQFLDNYDTSLEANFDTTDISYVVTDYHGNFDIVGNPPYNMVNKTKIGFYCE